MDSTRDAKLVQYLNEAYGKEKELETALEAHISMTTRAPYKKRLQQHLRETKSHARTVERRIKQLGGKAEILPVPGGSAVAGAASKALAAAKGPLHALRGTGEQEKMLKNAKTQFSDEAEEIASYKAIETLAETVGDRDTAKLARGIRREEERMSKFLEGLIPTLTKAVAQEEIPAAERRTARRSRSTAASRSRSTSSRSTSSRSTSSRSTKSRSTKSSRSRSTASGRSRSGSSGSRKASSPRSRSSRSRAASGSRARS
jgi:ferritin-like metal-binding protein YciE